MKLLLHRLPAIIKCFIVMGVALSLMSCATSPQLTSPSLKKSATLTLDNIDATVNAAMSGTGAKGLGVAVIDNGQVVFTKAYGVKNAANEPLDIDSIRLPCDAISG
jgi:CubicO group peptidase (beta-lactamase class C family)